MAQPIDNTFVRCLEFLILAITVGCSFWLTLLASGIVRVFDRA